MTKKEDKHFESSTKCWICDNVYADSDVKARDHCQITGKYRFLSSSLDSLFKNLGKDEFKYLSQEFDSKVLDLVKQKGFYPYEYLRSFEKFKEKLSSKEKFHSLLKCKKLVTKSMSMFLKLGIDWK